MKHFPTVLHTVSMTYLGATNNLGARIKLHSNRFKSSVTLGRNYAVDANEQAIEYLESKGFSILGVDFTGDKGIIVVAPDKNAPVFRDIK